MYVICPKSFKEECEVKHKCWYRKEFLACGDDIDGKYHEEYFEALESKARLRDGWKESMLRRNFHPDGPLLEYRIISPETMRDPLPLFPGEHGDKNKVRLRPKKLEKKRRRKNQIRKGERRQSDMIEKL
jgi:hypothetical protein